MDKRILVSLCFIMILSCNYIDNKKLRKEEDEFYTTIGGWDWIRVPLLKPYELLNVDPEIHNIWFVKFQSKELVNANYVKRADVVDSIVYVWCGTVDEKRDTTFFKGEKVATAWFVMDVRKKTEMGFLNEEEFNFYLEKNNYPQPHWYDIDSLLTGVARGSGLPWHPDK